MNAAVTTLAVLGGGALLLTGAAVAHPRRRPIYLDAQATTPLHPAVITAMRRADRTAWANPGSPHPPGRAARAALDTARHQVAQLLQAPDHRVCFTAGATEALNLAIVGSVRHAARTVPTPLHVLTTPIEHKAVLAPLRALTAEGLVELELLPIQSTGNLAPELATIPFAIHDVLRAALRPDTALVVIGWANNEIGTIQHLHAVAAALADHPARLIVDATQLAGFHPRLPPRVDAAALSAHKLHGPKGIGALLLRPDLELEPIMRGGGQEDGLRPGTVPVPLAVGFGEAARIATIEAPKRMARLIRGAQALWDRLEPLGVKLNGPRPDQRLPGNLSLTLPEGLTVAELRDRVPQLAFSQGSACSCSKRPSHVLEAIGLSGEEGVRTLRIGLHAGLGRREVAAAIEALTEAVGTGRSTTP